MMLAQKPLMSLTASDLMSDGVVMVPEQMSLQGAARILSRAQVSGAPVVDAQGRCVGVLSSGDFVRWAEKDCRSVAHAVPSESAYGEWHFCEREASGGCAEVADAMNRDPVLVRPDVGIRELARMMLDAHIHRVIVVDGHERPVGVVAATDILAAVARHDGE